MARNYQQRAEIRALRKENAALKSAFRAHPQTCYDSSMNERKSHYQEDVQEDGRVKIKTYGDMVRFLCTGCLYPFFSPEDRSNEKGPICPMGCGGHVAKTWTRLEELVFIEEQVK